MITYPCILPHIYPVSCGAETDMGPSSLIIIRVIMQIRSSLINVLLIQIYLKLHHTHGINGQYMEILFPVKFSLIKHIL